jgi:hypothetical protein
VGVLWMRRGCGVDASVGAGAGASAGFRGLEVRGFRGSGA